MSRASASAFRRAPGAPPIIYGHRGVRGPAPENTMAAFEEAARQGADGIELDVRPCGSGELVVAHDPSLERVAAGGDTRAIHEIPYAELSRVDLGAGERVPRLAEVLRWARGRRLRVNVEMKRDVPSRPQAIWKVARAVRLVPDAPRFVLISSFDPWMLLALRPICPGVSLALLFHAGQSRYQPFLVARAMGVEAANGERGLMSPRQVAATRGAGLVVNVWTVNDENEAARLSGLGVDGIITDRPGAVGEAARRG